LGLTRGRALLPLRRRADTFKATFFPRTSQLSMVIGTGAIDGIHAARQARARPALSQVGFNQLGLLLLLLDAGVCLADAVLFRSTLSIEWLTLVPTGGGLLVLCFVWLKFYLAPAGPKERMMAELVFLVALMALLTNLASVMQYGAVALGAPFADSRLAAADAAIGVHVPSLAQWTRAHPIVDLLLTVSYASLFAQYFVAIGLLAAFRHRTQFWEFAFHFHFCLIATVAALAIVPAVCPPVYYGFQPTIDMTRAIQQIRGFHAGTMTVVRFDQMEGLVSFPSFHVAGALITTWAVRHRRGIFIPYALLNVALIASTMLSGVHYAVDAIAALPLFAISVAVYRCWASRLLPVEAVAPQGFRDLDAPARARITAVPANGFVARDSTSPAE
jgi:hypothetical protein